MQPRLTFVQISDSHVGPTEDFELHSFRTFACLDSAISRINEFPQPPDFVIHTGDLINDQNGASYAVAAKAMNRLHVPAYYVCGNHDERALLRQHFGCPPHPSGDPNAPLDYTFEVKGEQFVVLDTSSRDVPPPQGHLDEAQLAWFRAAIEHPGPLTVLMHHSPFPMGSPWLDENMSIQNGAALHEILLPVRDRLHGVFHGHLHRSCQTVRDGITYTCAGSTALQYGWRPWDPKPLPDPDNPPGYNVVHYLDGYIVAHAYTFPVPGTM
jgi:Icc protein